MSSIRQEYKKYINKKSKTVDEAALKWVEKNVVLINEKIDRTTVTRLIDNIQKFEDTFGVFTDRLPAIGNYLDSAEQGLQLVITGKANDKKASNMLKKLSILYFTFSDFFTRDLPILLRTKMFKAAKDQPDVRLDMIGNKLGSAQPSHNLNAIRDALANALKPSKEEKKLLAKIYRSSLLPKLNAQEIANQLLTLAYSDLEELTKIGKVPLVATEDEVSDTGEAEVTESKENLNEEALNEEALNEAANFLSEAKIEELQGQVNNLKKLIDNSGLDKLRSKIDKLQSDLLQAMNSDAFTSYWNAVKQAKSQGGLGNSLKTLFSKSPQAKEIASLLGRTNATIETFKSIASAWPKLQSTLENKDTITATDVNNIKKILANAAPKTKKGGLLAKALNALVGGGADDPYISAEEIVDALVADLE